MKHIKTYKIFESIKLPDGVSAETIEEICYDITDDSRFKCDVSFVNHYGNYIIISLTDVKDFDGFKFSEVKECVLRLRRYLGDHFYACTVRFVGDADRRNMSLLIDENDMDSYDDKNISNLAILIG